MSARRLASVLAFLSIAPAASTARAGDVAPRALTAASDARACTPTAGGGVAVATGGGLVLVRPGGARVVVTSLDGLPETRAHAIAEDGDALWVGTEHGAARVRTADARIMRSVGSHPVHAVLRTAAGTVYLGTWGDGVTRIASALAPSVKLDVPPGMSRVTSLVEHDGAVLASFAEGAIAKLVGARFEIVARGVVSPAALASEPGRGVWVGALDGVRGLSRAATVTSADARALASAPPGWLVGTFGSGVRVGRSLASLRPLDATPRFVRGVGVAHARYCVASTEGLHVGLVTPVGFERPRAVALGTMPSSDVSAIATSGDKLAVGTFDAGLAITDLSGSPQFTRVATIARHETVNALAWEGRGADRHLWVATSHGVVRTGPSGTRRWTTASGLPSTVVRAILVVGPGRALIGTERGAAWVSGDQVTPVAAREKGKSPGVDSPMHATWAVARTADDRLLLGTSTGLYIGRPGHFVRASLASGHLKDDWITALTVRGADVFVGTYAHGVTKLSLAGEEVRSVTHLGGGYVNPSGLTLDGAVLMASTMDGLLVRSATDDGAKWTKAERASVGRDVTQSAVVGDRLYVASRRGLTVRARY